MIFRKQTGKGRNGVQEKALWKKDPKSTGALKGPEAQYLFRTMVSMPTWSFEASFF